jgi:hypothetical protein
MDASDSENQSLIAETSFNHIDLGDVHLESSEQLSATMRQLLETDELIFPLSKSAYTQYSEDPNEPLEFRLYYGTKEICFDDPEQFAFGEALAKQSRFMAGDALSWGQSDWPRVREMLEDLIAHEVLRYADESDVDAVLAIDREDRDSPLAPAQIDAPVTWDDVENVMLKLTGTPLELANLELVVPIFRVAHMYMDSDGRQVGEANVFPPSLRLDRPTQWRTCTYSGTRYQPNRPMNVTALKVMRVHWRQMMAVLLQVREAYFKRFPDARNGWTVGDLERASVAVLALPSLVLLRQDDPVENGNLHPVLSSIFRVTDGLRMTMHQMLFVPFGEPTRKPSTPMTATEVYAYAERNRSLHSDHGVCAGPQFMIEEFLSVFLEGAEPKSGMPRATHPDVQVALDVLEQAVDYGLLGLQAFATIFSLWPALAGTYHDLFNAIDGWKGERSASFDALHARFEKHNGDLLRETYLAKEEWRDDRIMVYGEMYAKCGFGLTGAIPARSLRERLSESNPDQTIVITVQLTEAFERHFADMQLSLALSQQLAHITAKFLDRTQATLKLAEEVQSGINGLLGRAPSVRRFSAGDINLYNLMHGEGDNILPYLINEIGGLLGINIAIDAANMKITNLNVVSAVLTEIQAA